MALYNVRAIVVGVQAFGDADKSVTIFTRERGTVRAIAFGCRRPRSPLAASMQMLLTLDVQLSEGKKVDTVRQANIVRVPRKLTEDLTAMAYASFVAEFVREFLPEGQPDERAYETLSQVLEAFETRNPRVTALAAVWQLLEFTGMQLSLERCIRCSRKLEGDARFHEGAGGAICNDCEAPPGAEPFPKRVRMLILRLRDLDWKDETPLKITVKDLLEAERILLNHVRNLLGRELNALRFIRQLL